MKLIAASIISTFAQLLLGSPVDPFFSSTSMHSFNVDFPFACGIGNIDCTNPSILPPQPLPETPIQPLPQPQPKPCQQPFPQPGPAPQFQPQPEPCQQPQPKPIPMMPQPQPQSCPEQQPQPQPEVTPQPQPCPQQQIQDPCPHQAQDDNTQNVTINQNNY